MKKAYLLNNRGQALVMFVLFIPVLLVALGFIVDLGLVIYEKEKLNGINKTTLDYVLSHKEDYEEEKVKQLVLKNDEEIIIKEFLISPDVCLILEKDIDSIFGPIFGFKSYKITSKYKVDFEEEKVLRIEE